MSDEDLTTAALYGFHQRDDEVAALKAEIERLQAQIALLKAVVRELAPYPADKLPPHIKRALGE